MSDEEDALLPVETFRPVDNYSEVDPNFTDFADDVGEDVDLTEDELEPPEVDEENEALVPYWATFELHGRNLDQQTSWRNLASEEFDGNFEVEVEGLTAGARWEFRIRLIDRNGRYSKWSEPLQITLPVDFTPPPRPTPPLLNELLGFIRLGWDGELEGTIPSDMSHTNLRIQQMYPEGDPDGEPGDPRLVTRLQAEGWYAAGLLPNVPHRAFLTAVDTTGNESPWSDFTEFHPEPAFDTTELEEKLEHLNDEVLPEMKTELEVSISEVHEGLRDFRTEWDESGWDPEAMADLEARQGTLESDLSTGLSEANQAITSFREEWDENWDPEAISGLVERADDLEDNLQQGLANAEQSYRSLAITGPRNINADPKFETFDNGDSQSWRNLDGGWHPETTSWGDPHKEALRLSSDAYDDGLYYVSYGGNAPFNAILECLPGETFKTRFQVIRYTGYSLDDNYRMQFRWVDGERNGLSWSTIQWGRVGNRGWVEEEVTAPEGAAYFYFRFVKSGIVQSARGFLNVSVRSMTTGDLTVDGTMLARHVDMEDFTADAGFIDNAFVNLIQGKMANFDQAIIGGALIKDNAISAGKLAVVPDGRDLAPDLVDYADLWTLGSQVRIASSTGSESGLALRIDGDASSVSGRAYGPWIPVRAGDTIYYKLTVSWYNRSPDGELRIYVMYNGSLTSWTRLHSATAINDYEGHFTIPRDGTTKIAFGVNIDSSATNGGNWAVRDFDVRVAAKGVHITPQGIKSPQVDTAELTASSAFLDNAMVNLIQGRMANFDEALIGGALLRNNTVATRHLTVTNTEDLFPQEWMDDLTDANYIFSPAASSLSANSFNTRFFQDDPTDVDSGNVEWTTTTLQGDRGFQVWPNRNPGTNQRIAFRLGPGKGVMVRPGEQYTFRCRVRDRNDGNFFDVRMALADVETGEGLTQTQAPGRSIRGLVHGADGEFVWTFTIPDNFPRMWMVPSFHSGANSSSSARSILRPQLFRAVDGKLIVDGLLQAGTGILDELFFDSAVGNTIAASAAQFMTAHADHLIANAIDGSVITGAMLVGGELQVGQRFTGGGQSGVHITGDRSNGHFQAWDNSGALSARLGGAENFLRGSIFAGPDQAHGLDLNYTSTPVQVGWDDFEEPDEVLQNRVVPRVNFHTHHNHAVHPQIWVNEDTGSMEINPGRLSGSSSGSGQLRLWGRVHANRVTTRRLDVPSTSSLQPGGLRRSGPNTSLRGRSARGTENAYEMFVTGQSPTSNSTNWRGGITWAYPPRNGMRRAVISGNLSETAVNNWRILGTAVGGSSTSGYRYSHRQSHSENGNQSHYYNAVWF